jgi:hypothetical protein
VNIVAKRPLAALLVLGACSSQNHAAPDAAPPIDAAPIDADAPIVVDASHCDGELCPDPTVANTTPFTGGVYLHGGVDNGFCGSDQVQQFAPSLSLSPLGFFSCQINQFRFRRSDGALFYNETFVGIVEHTPPTDTQVTTAPCSDPFGVGAFDFDAAGTLYYQCGAAVMKTGGAVVAQPVADLVAVLDDGRVIATRPGAVTGVFDYVVLDAAGTELSRLSLATTFVGQRTEVPAAATIAGNRGYVAYLRTYDVDQHEIVVFRVDERSQWALVRRLPVAAFGTSQLVLSDGTVYIADQDPNNFEEVTQRITAYAPDGTHREVWHDYDLGAIHSVFKDEILVVGP